MAVQTRQRIYIAATAIISIVPAIAAVWLWPVVLDSLTLWLVPVFLLLISSAGRFPFKVSPQGDSTATTVPMFMAVLLLHPALAVLAGAAGALVSESLLRPPPKVAIFNISLTAMASGLAGVTFWLVRPEIIDPASPAFGMSTVLPAAVAGIVLNATGLALLMGMITIIKGRAFWQIWKSNWAFQAVLDANLLMVGLVGAQLIAFSLWWFIPLVTISVVAYFGFKWSIKESLEKTTEMALRIEAMEKLEESEKQARKLSGENAAMAEISRIVSSSYDLTEVIDDFAREVGKLIPLKGTSISLLTNGNPDSYTVVSEWGEKFESKLNGTGVESSLKLSNASGKVSASEALLNTANLACNVEQHQATNGVGATKNQSLISVSIISAGKAVGLFNLWCSTPDHYTDDSIRVANRIAIQITGAVVNSRLYRELQSSQERLRQLTHKIVAAQEDERLRVSRELHDEAGQSLTALRITLDLLKAGLPEESEALHKRVDSAVRLTGSTVQSIRFLAQNLRPPGLEGLSLNDSLKKFCLDFANRTQMPIEYQGEEVGPVHEAINLSFYRCLQEGLNNAAKYACADWIEVSLVLRHDTIMLTIEDNGKGFVPHQSMVAPEKSKGLGLLGIKERFEMLGGWFEVASEPGQGTRLTASVAKGAQ
jgi:signal transduction histidine kinase